MVCTVVIVSSCYSILLHLLADYLVGAVEVWLYRTLGGDVHTCKLTSCGRWIIFLTTFYKRPLLTGIKTFIFGVLSILCQA